MAYTLWHQGMLIGETDFEGDRLAPRRSGPARRHLAGVFRPTPHGRGLLPRLSGILTASADLRDELVRRGLNPDDLPPGELPCLLDSSDAGARILDIGRALSEIELRAPDGTAMTIASIAFMDLAELATLSARLGTDAAVNLGEVPPEVADFIVSVTVRAPRRGWPPLAMRH